MGRMGRPGKRAGEFESEGWVEIKGNGRGGRWAEGKGVRGKRLEVTNSPIQCGSVRI